MTTAKLFILGQEIELLWADMHYNRELQINGKPNTDVMGGLITLCFATTYNTDQILRWMTKESKDDTWEEVDKMEEGKVCFYANGFNYPPTKTYKFNDAVLVYFKEFFYAEGAQPMQTIITISPAIQNYGTDFIKRWNVSYIPPSEKMPYQPKQDLTKRVVECYYTDLNGNKQAELQTGEEAYLVLKTENAIGETIDIDLTNHTKDFIYNDEIIENDIIKNFNVTNNLHKIKLRVIVQQEGERETIQN